MDKETQKVVAEGQQIQDFVTSDAWQTIKRKLYDRLVQLDSIDGMILDEKEDLKQQILARKATIDTIRKWIEEIEGISNQHNNNKRLYEMRQDEIVVTFES